MFHITSIDKRQEDFPQKGSLAAVKTNMRQRPQQNAKQSYKAWSADRLQNQKIMKKMSEEKKETKNKQVTKNTKTVTRKKS